MEAFGIAPPGFRLPAASHAGGVHLLVSDREASRAFYERTIGLRTLSSTADSVTLGPHGAERPLVTLRSRPGVTRARRGAFGLYHFAILLPDRAALGRFLTHLSRLEIRVAMADHLVSEAIYLWDPDGLGIEVYADRPRDAWEQHDRELVMTTARLDMPAVMAAAGGAAWAGAPAGTTMGHVHLHVEALDAAEAFYHRTLGFDKTVWSYPGALFMSAGGYHHHLATNVWSSGPAPGSDEAQLIEWELLVPTREDVSAVGRSASAAGYVTQQGGADAVIADPWGTRVRVRAQAGAPDATPGDARGVRPRPN